MIDNIGEMVQFNTEYINLSQEQNVIFERHMFFDNERDRDICYNELILLNLDYKYSLSISPLQFDNIS